MYAPQRLVPHDAGRSDAHHDEVGRGSGLEVATPARAADILRPQLNLLGLMHGKTDVYTTRFVQRQIDDSDLKPVISERRANPCGGRRGIRRRSTRLVKMSTAMGRNRPLPVSRPMPIRPSRGGGWDFEAATSGLLAERSDGSAFRGPSPTFAVLHGEALLGGAWRQCQQTSC